MTVVIEGFASVHVVRAAAGIDRVLAKPVQRAALAEALAHALDLPEAGTGG